MAVVSRCRHDGNITISVQDLLQADILRDVAERAKDAIAVESVFDLGAELDAPFSLTPIQEMFLAATSRMEYSQSFLLKMNSKVSGQKLQEAFDTLVGRHSMLRARFQRDINANSWKQQVTPFDRKAYSLNFYGSTTLEHVYQVNSKTRSTLDICTGPVFAANIFHDEIGTNRICFLTAHHMIIDLVSWRIILRDLEELLLSPDVGAKPSVHPLSFETWARLQREFVNRLPTSVSAPNTESQSPNFRYWGMENTLSTFDCLDTLKFELSSDHTAALLGPANATLSTEPADILLGITMHAFAATFRDRTMPAFFTESHGRESWHSSIDPSETIGWFTTMYPILTTNKSPKDVMDTISDVKDARRKIADKGFAWFSSQFLNSDYNESPVRQGAVEIIFNYFGMYQQLEREGSLFTPINTIEMQPTEEGGAGTARMSLLEVDIAVYHGRLQFSLLFDRKMRHQDRLLAFKQQAQYFFEEAARILPERQRKLTASDVPLLNIGCTQLDELMTTVITKAGFSAADVQSMYPCSSMQEDILNSQAKDLGYYNTRLVWRADGKTTSSINSLRLDNAWRQLCKRHAILRSTFLPNPWIPGKWFQIAARATLPAVEHIDGPLQTVEHVCRAIADDATPNWNVPRPRHRLKIWPTLEGTIICQIDISHVLIDGTATETIMRDWLACYNDSVLQQASAYERYIEFLQSQPRHRELEYWMRYAQDMPTTILRTHSLDALQPLRTNHIMDIPVARLRKCCETYQTTPACVFRAAWALALSRYGDSDDVVFGYLAHGRDAPITSARTIVGPMVLTLPCWVRGTRDSSLSTILRQVQQDMVKSLSAQNVSWGEVERACRRQERPFDTLVNYRKAVDATIDLGSAITLTELWTYDPMEYTIVMEVEQSANYARICLNYWDRHLARPALAIVQQHLEDSLSELL
jgi:non-ribosomal peptide synthase protein (TIGR01720 family)